MYEYSIKFDKKTGSEFCKTFNKKMWIRKKLLKCSTEEQVWLLYNNLKKSDFISNIALKPMYKEFKQRAEKLSIPKNTIILKKRCLVG